jgi:hypothetical protein
MYSTLRGTGVIIMQKLTTIVRMLIKGFDKVAAGSNRTANALSGAAQTLEGLTKIVQGLSKLLRAISPEDSSSK